jgi:sugar (pentulose or hexulose) kinase
MHKNAGESKAIIRAITEGKTVLGIELGSTRIKAVLLDESYAPIASGGHDWVNRLEDGIWTYHLDDVRLGVQDSFRALRQDVARRYGTELAAVGAIGVSAMMHGYLVFDKTGRQLAQFRTWRNTMTEQAAAVLTKAFNFNIPQRWSAAHLYQAVLNGESHVKDIAFITTLSGYVHKVLTGEAVLGVGDASGMFPIDSATGSWNERMLGQFDALVAESGREADWHLFDILPRPLRAGENAGVLTSEGARFLDPSGCLKAGIPLCPPEGDAGTGMVATNSVAARKGNVSAGTSIFAMVVLEKELSKVWPEIDLVTTPSGKPVAMAHCNNCTSDIDAWVELFREAIELSGATIGKAELYDALYLKALDGAPDCGGLLSYNYYSGEPVTGLKEGRPLFTRTADSELSLANFMRTHIFSALATLKLGMDILSREHVRVDTLLGHGGLFKSAGVSQRLLAAALNVPVAVMDSAGEGGAWGIALLAAYRLHKETGGSDSIESFLDQRVFAGNSGSRVLPDSRDVDGFRSFITRYTDGLAIERAAVDHLK